MAPHCNVDRGGHALARKHAHSIREGNERTTHDGVLGVWPCPCSFGLSFSQGRLQALVTTDRPIPTHPAHTRTRPATPHGPNHPCPPRPTPRPIRPTTPPGPPPRPPRHKKTPVRPRCPALIDALGFCTCRWACFRACR